MSKEDQARIVSEMAYGLRDTMIEFIWADKVPESWNGHELRRWFAELAKERYAMGGMGIARTREYNNVRLVNNI